MTQKNKDRGINTLLGIVMGCSILAFGSFWNGKIEDNAATKEDIENLELTKADKVDLARMNKQNNLEHKRIILLQESKIKEYKEVNEKQLELILNHIDTRFDDQKELIKALIK